MFYCFLCFIVLYGCISEKGYHTTVQILLEEGNADVIKVDQYGRTALMLAIITTTTITTATNGATEAITATTNL